MRVGTSIVPSTIGRLASPESALARLICTDKLQEIASLKHQEQTRLTAGLFLVHESKTRTPVKPADQVVTD